MVDIRDVGINNSNMSSISFDADAGIINRRTVHIATIKGDVMAEVRSHWQRDSGIQDQSE